VAYNGRIINEWWQEKDAERKSVVCIKLSSWRDCKKKPQEVGIPSEIQTGTCCFSLSCVKH
jgi:hypothetical protein